MKKEKIFKVLVWNIQSRLEQGCNFKKISNNLTELTAIAKLADQTKLSELSDVLSSELITALENDLLVDTRNFSRKNRAKKIYESIISLEPEIIILTEVKPGESFGGFIKSELENKGYSVSITGNGSSTCAVLIAIKGALKVNTAERQPCFKSKDTKIDFTDRVFKTSFSIIQENDDTNIEILAIHVPPAFNYDGVKNRKEPFLEFCCEYFDEVERNNTLSIIGGDFNPYAGFKQDDFAKRGIHTTDVISLLNSKGWLNCLPQEGTKGRNGIGNDANSPNQLDYLYLSPELKKIVEKYSAGFQPDKIKIGGKIYLSDHDPLFIELKLK